MIDLRALGLVAMVAAALTAVLLAHRRVNHVPAAVALVLLAALNVARGPLNAALSPHPLDPWQGAARWLVYLDGAAQLAVGAVVPGLALAVSVPPARRRRAVAAVVGAWLLASVVLAALYPSPVVRGIGLQRIYLAADLIGLLVSAVALVGWARRGIAAGRSPGSAPAVAIGLVLLDLAILVTPFSPWRGSVFEGRYDVIQVEIVGFFAVVSAAQVLLWRFSAR